MASLMKPLLGIGLLALLLATMACSQSVDESQQLYIFGTLLDVELVDVEREQSQQVFSRLNHQFQYMHREWHGWKPGGELYEINRRIAEGMGTIPVSVMLRPLIRRSKQLYEMSDGLFNPAMGRLIDLWGFHQDERPEGAPPREQAIQSLLKQQADMDDLTLEADRLFSRNKAVNLDFGAFAKGYALDLARTELKLNGVSHAMLNAGGDLCVMGRHHERPWRVGIRHPQGGGVLASLELADGECVMTSGNYERYREHEGVHYNHILDPRDGQPVEGVVSVTVIAEEGGLADAAATALTVAGSEGWFALAHKMGLKYVMLVDDDGTVYMNPAMADRIRYEERRPGKVVISHAL